jgi:NAD(P)H-dependent FMN reductase
VSKPRIAIVLSTTRAARFGHKAGQWLYDIAKQRSDIEVEQIDLRDYPLPFFDEVATNAWAPTQNADGVRWQKKVGQYDGYIFVTAEYNHGVPAVLKNALDYAYPEWCRKAAALFRLRRGRRRPCDRAVAADLRRTADGPDENRRASGGDGFHGGYARRQADHRIRLPEADR